MCHEQESYFQYLTGVKEPDCAVLIDVEKSGHTTLFIPRLPTEYATFMGKIRTPAEWQDLYHVDAVRYQDESMDVLRQCLHFDVTATTGGTNGKKPKKLLLLKGVNSDSGNTYQPPQDVIQELKDRVDLDTLFPILADLRVYKSRAELGVLRYVTEVTSFAHAYVMRNMKPGMMEYQGESLFRHYCYYSYGCRLVGYTPICGCGPNAAILHYGHAGEPNARQSQDGDTCLFDMGCEYFCYGSDVTCSFPISGKFTAQQLPIYSAVMNAQVAVYNMLQPGVSWVDCHKAAELEILRKLAEIGLVVPGDNTLAFDSA